MAPSMSSTINQQTAKRRVEPRLVGRERDRRLQRRECIVQIRRVSRPARILIPVPVVNPEVVLRLGCLWQARDHQMEQSDCAIVIAERADRGAQAIPGFDEVGAQAKRAGVGVDRVIRMASSFEREREMKMSCSQAGIQADRLPERGDRRGEVTVVATSTPIASWDTASAGSSATAARKAASAAAGSPLDMSDTPRSRCCAAVRESWAGSAPAASVMATAQASGRPYITSPAGRRRRSFANNPHDDSLQFLVRILGSSLFVQLGHTREELLCARDVAYPAIGLPEQI